MDICKLLLSNGRMRGKDVKQSVLFSYKSIEEVIPKDHPIRQIREMVDFVLKRMSRRLGQVYADRGRASIPPERLLRAMVVQILYSVRSERLLMEQMGYNMLFKWFVGLNPDDPVWDPSTFSKNRERLLKGNVARRFFREVVALARNEGLLSEEHFTVDGTLIQSVANLKSFQPRGSRSRRSDDDPGNPSMDFHGEKRSNRTHQSTTDPDALLARKGAGKEAKLSFTASALTENRNGIVVDCDLRPATGTAERDAAAEMLRAHTKEGGRASTLGADKGYDTKQFVATVREEGVTPHVASKKRGSAIDGRTTRHATYAVSQRKRKRIEEVFGWAKTVGLMARSRFVGTARTGMAFTFCMAVYNLVRIVGPADAR